jgi:hypothetical protein
MQDDKNAPTPGASSNDEDSGIEIETKASPMKPGGPSHASNPDKV